MSALTHKFTLAIAAVIVAMAALVAYFYYKAPQLTYVYPRIVADVDTRALQFGAMPTSFSFRGHSQPTIDGVTYARFTADHESGRIESLVAIEPGSDQPMWIAEIPNSRVTTPCVAGEALYCAESAFDLTTGERAPHEPVSYDRPPSGYVGLGPTSAGNIPGLLPSGQLVSGSTIIAGPTFDNPSQVRAKVVEIPSFLRTREIVIVSDATMTRAIEGDTELWHDVGVTDHMGNSREPQFTVSGTTVVLGRISSISGRDPLTGETIWSIPYRGYAGLYSEDQVLLTDTGRAVLIEFGDEPEGDPDDLVDYGVMMDVPVMENETLTVPPMCGLEENDVTFNGSLAKVGEASLRVDNPTTTTLDGALHYLVEIECTHERRTSSSLVLYDDAWNLVGSLSTTDLGLEDANFYNPIMLGRDLTVGYRLTDSEVIRWTKLEWDGNRFSQREDRP